MLLKQETVSGSGTSWARCKSAPHSRQITMPAPHSSVFYKPDALPAAQPTVSKHWRHLYQTNNEREFIRISVICKKTVTAKCNVNWLIHTVQNFSTCRKKCFYANNFYLVSGHGEKHLLRSQWQVSQASDDIHPFEPNDWITHIQCTWCHILYIH